MKKAVIAALAAVSVLSGCYRPEQVNTLAYLMAVGIDNGEYTLEFANPVAFAGEDPGNLGGEDSSLISTTVQSDSLYEAFAKAESTLLKKIDTSYTKLIVFNCDYNNGNIKNDIDFMINSPRFNPKTYVAFSECTAKEYFSKLKSPLETNPARYFDNIFSPDFNEYAPEAILKNASAHNVLFPLVDENDNRAGTIAAENGKVMYKKTAESGRIYNIVTCNLKSVDYSAGGLTVRLYQGAKTKTEIKSVKPPETVFTVSLKGEILENPGGLKEEEAETIIRDALRDEISGELYNSYKLENFDLFGVLPLFKKKFLTNGEYEKFAKDISPSDISYEVFAKINIQRDGTFKKER